MEIIAEVAAERAVHRSPRGPSNHKQQSSWQLAYAGFQRDHVEVTARMLSTAVLYYLEVAEEG